MLQKLSTYRQKRDFEKTPEPSGKTAVAPSKQRRFVIQKHDATRLHYDLRLEFDGVFKSWAVTQGPSLDPHDKRLAVEVEDHPLDYGDFEGTIPEGQYGGGTVMLWDRGTWESDDPERGFKKGDLKFTLHGDKLHGSWVLVRMRNDRNGGKRTNWLLIKHRDEYASEGEDNDILEEDKSVASGRAMEQIAAGKGTAPKPFMLAKGSARPRPMRSGIPTAARREGARTGKPAPRAALKTAQDGEEESHDRDDARRSSEMPDFVAPQLCTLGRAPAERRGLVPRDQVRRLPRAAAGRGRRGDAEDAQRPGLDRQVRSHREGGGRAAGRADRRRDRRARPQRRAEFFGAAGRDCRTARPTI